MLDACLFKGDRQGSTSEFLRQEILRVGAPAAELKSALAFVGSEAGFDPRAYDALSPRMRRLVDLMAVAGTAMCDLPEAGSAAAI